MCVCVFSITAKRPGIRESIYVETCVNYLLVVVLYARELSFNKGDVISVIRRVDPNWFEAKFKGKIGLVPSSYIEVLRMLHNIGLLYKVICYKWHLHIQYNLNWQLKLLAADRLCNYSMLICRSVRIN